MQQSWSMGRKEEGGKKCLGRESCLVEVESKPGNGSQHRPPAMPGGLADNVYIRQSENNGL